MPLSFQAWSGMAPAAMLDPELLRFLDHLRVERRLAPRTVAMYGEALRRLQAAAEASQVPLKRAEAHHLRPWPAGLRGQ